ncbi:MAG: SAM-dependent methyltransferase [Sphingobacterium sp.]|nr:SAM-dependent methyltransferase [Sphingobacterium sp.]
MPCRIVPRSISSAPGPGDPGLLTLRGAACLGRADVVVYDRLVHTAVLRHARPGAERIDVGRAAPQGTDRDAIAYLLVEKVREGKRVARLKWGDPFIFDDGGEEALFLHEHGDPVRGRARRPGGRRHAAVRRRGRHVPRRRRHADAGARARGCQRHDARRSTGPAWPASTAPSCATPARGSCRRCCRPLRDARPAGRRARRAHLQRHAG